MSSTTVAIVCHGAGAEGRSLGNRIDACDLVVRLHDCAWQSGAVDDWGRRWDIGVLPGPWRHRRAARWQDGREGAPVQAWWCYTLSPLDAPPDAYAGVSVEAVDLGWTKNALLRPGMARAAPSRGLAAALMALRRCRCASLVLVAASRLATGRLDGSDYARALTEGAGKPSEAHLRGHIVGPHHYGAERDLLAAEAAARGTRLEFWP